MLQRKHSFYDFSVETLKMSHGEVTVKCPLEIPCHSVTSHFKSFYGEVSFLVYNYFLVVMLFPLNSPLQKSTPIPQSYQRVSSLHVARKTQSCQWITRKNILNDAFVEK